MKSLLNFEVPGKTQTGSTALALFFVICFVSTVFSGAVSTLMSVYLPVVIKDLKDNQSERTLSNTSALISALFILGWAVGGFLWGVISDSAGRKAALLLSIASYSIFTMLTGLAQNLNEVMLCRFFSGFGVGGLLVVSFTLLSEIWPYKSKAVYTGILSIAFPVGIFSAGLINYFVTSWRQGFMIGIVPLLLAVGGFWLVKESGLWLNSKTDKLKKQEVAGHLFSGANIKTVAIGSIIFGTMLIGLWAIFSWMPTWIESLDTVNSSKAGGLSMMFLGMGGLTGGVFSGWLVSFAGMRKSLIICFSVCALASFILFKTNHSLSGIIYAEVTVLSLFFGASQGVLSIYIPLLFKTPVRASSTGFCFNAGRLFTAAAVFFVGFLVSKLGGYGNALFIFSLVFIIGLTAILMIKKIHPDN